MTPDDVHLLTGAYALDALDPAERRSFERHLAECETCAVEAASLTEAVARLADDSWSAPPPRLRAAVLEQIAGTRQSPPAQPTPRRETASAWRRRSALALAAAVAAVVAGGGVFLVQEQRVRDERAVAEAARQRQAQIDAVLSAPDASTKTADVTGGGRVVVVASVQRDAAVVVVAGATPPGAEKAYELWTIRGTTPSPAGVLAADTGTATHYVAGISGAAALAMTVEPAAGSATPTLPIVAQIALT